MSISEQQLNEFVVDFLSQAILKPCLEVNFPNRSSRFQTKYNPGKIAF